MTLYELRKKDVIQMQTGENLGRVDDVVFETESACIRRLILRGRPRWFGLFGRDDDLEIHWQDIRSIGADVIMVEVEQPSSGRQRSHRPRFK